MKSLSGLPWPRYAWTEPGSPLPHEQVDPAKVLIELRGRIYGIHRQPAPFVMIEDTDDVEVEYLDGRKSQGIPQFDPLSGRIMFAEVPKLKGKSLTADGHHRDVVDQICAQIDLLTKFEGLAWVLRQVGRFPGKSLTDPQKLRGPDLAPILEYHDGAASRPTIEQVISIALSNDFVGAKTTKFVTRLPNMPDDHTVRLWHAQPSLRLPDGFQVIDISDPHADTAARLNKKELDSTHIKTLLGSKLPDGRAHFESTEVARWEAGKALMIMAGLPEKQIDQDTHPDIRRVKAQSLDRASNQIS